MSSYFVARNFKYFPICYFCQLWIPYAYVRAKKESIKSCSKKIIYRKNVRASSTVVIAIPEVFYNHQC